MDTLHTDLMHALNSIDDDNEFRRIVSSMKLTTDHKELCQNETNTLKKCILCKRFLSANQWSVIMESHIKGRFNIGKPNNCVSGDGCSIINGINVEIKVSLGDSQGQMNFVQLRPDHKIDYYLLLAYNLFESTMGSVYWFLCRADDLYELVPLYGSYAHGTIEKLGVITSDNMKGRNCEYCLRPNPLKPTGTKQRALWDVMVERFLRSEEDIQRIL